MPLTAASSFGMLRPSARRRPPRWRGSSAPAPAPTSRNADARHRASHGRTDDLLIAVHQHGFDAGRAEIETQIHVFLPLPLRQIVFQEYVDTDAFLRVDDRRPSALAFSTRMALRTSWPASWLRMASIVPSCRAARVCGVSSCAITTVSDDRRLFLQRLDQAAIAGAEAVDADDAVACFAKRIGPAYAPSQGRRGPRSQAGSQIPEIDGAERARKSPSRRSRWSRTSIEPARTATSPLARQEPPQQARGGPPGCDIVDAGIVIALRTGEIGNHGDDSECPLHQRSIARAPRAHRRNERDAGIGRSSPSRSRRRPALPDRRPEPRWCGYRCGPPASARRGSATSAFSPCMKELSLAGR
jgi:hypothetical protein